MTATKKMQWADPPNARRGALGDPELIAFAEALRTHPEKWAIYPNTLKAPGRLMKYVRDGRGSFAPGGFEAVVRKNVLYVRYVGEPSR